MKMSSSSAEASAARKPHGVEAAIDRKLGEPYGIRRRIRHCARNGEARFISSPSGTTWLTMPRGLGAIGRQLIVTREQQLLRRLRPATHGKSSATAPEPNSDFRRAELRRLRGHGHIARKRQLERAADAVAVHRGDRRLRAMPEAHDEDRNPPRASPAIRGSALPGRRRSCLEVEAGGERTPRASHHDGRNAIVRLERRKGLHRFAHELTVESVQYLGPVECEHGDAVGDFDVERVVGRVGAAPWIRRQLKPKAIERPVRRDGGGDTEGLQRM